MQMILQLLEHLGSEPSHGSNNISKLDLINRPRRPEGDITLNRREVFKEFNYRFNS